jgi:hypothetical protein
MALRDLLAGEHTDHLQSAALAMQGRSQTGYSGLHTEMGPIHGRLVSPLPVQRLAPDGSTSIDPELVRRHLPEPANRIPFGGDELQLAREVEPGFRYYWFNDTPGRINRAKRAGYTHVIDADTGEPENIVTDRAEGRGRKSYLMKIPMEWYQADMARQADALARRLNDIRHGRAGPGSEDSRYIPSRGITITGR